jgi:hypothetical protein
MSRNIQIGALGTIRSDDEAFFTKFFNESKKLADSDDLKKSQFKIVTIKGSSMVFTITDENLDEKVHNFLSGKLAKKQFQRLAKKLCQNNSVSFTTTGKGIVLKHNKDGQMDLEELI